MMVGVQVERIALAELSPHPRNARRGDVEAIAESLRENGQYRPIVVASDGTVLAGNHTLAAARLLGWESLEVVRLPLDPSEPAALRVMLADNRTAALGGYDEAVLLEVLEVLDTDTLLPGSGYSDADLDALRHLIEAPDLSDVVDDVGDPEPGDMLATVTLHLPREVADEVRAAIRATSLEAPASHLAAVRSWLGLA